MRILKRGVDLAGKSLARVPLDVGDTIAIAVVAFLFGCMAQRIWGDGTCLTSLWPI